MRFTVDIPFSVFPIIIYSIASLHLAPHTDRASHAKCPMSYKSHPPIPLDPASASKPCGSSRQSCLWGGHPIGHGREQRAIQPSSVRGSDRVRTRPAPRRREIETCRRGYWCQYFRAGCESQRRASVALPRAG